MRAKANHFILHFYLTLALPLTLFSVRDKINIYGMFDFEKLTVYEKAKEFHLNNEQLLKAAAIPTPSRQQLHRASLSVILNLAEGCGRFTKADRKNFYIISRSSVFECIALLDILKSTKSIEVDLFNTQYSLGEELSKIILSLIKSLG